MNLTHVDAWHVTAGGSFAAPDRHGFHAITNSGEYVIQPVSSRSNVNRHCGYRVWYVNTNGQHGPGLWQQLAPGLVTLPAARRLCRAHFERVLSPCGVLLIPAYDAAQA